MRYATCDQCKEWGYVGWMPCQNKWLCAKCAGKVLRVDAGEVQSALSAGMNLLPNVEKQRQRKGGKALKR